MIPEKEKNNLITFIQSREQTEGGFSFSQTTPATLEDTYFALRLLEKLNAPTMSRQTISFVTQLDRHDFLFPKHFYRLAIIYRIAHQIDLEKSLRNKIIHNQKIILNTLSDVYYSMLTKELFQIVPTNLMKNEQDIFTSVQMKPVKSMEEYTQLIMLIKRFHISFPTHEYVTIILNSQNHDGGFGIVPHSTSYLEPTYQALCGLKEVHFLPIDIQQCERFINSCMANIGGYGRQIITVPTLEYSYYALMSLIIIGEMKNSKW